MDSKLGGQESKTDLVLRLPGEFVATPQHRLEISMSPISTAVQQVLQARQDATRSQIDMALLGQQLDVQQQTGDAINQMIRDVVNVQKQISNGHIDVRV